ncbi:MAG: hypothetical protein HQL07_12290 [Nitrospirae bacterium]|nr:hypothetical protein [Magnetococcales bacterium]HAT51183.1 hypothetical protein [Alphaproteobacteria bacterium]
MKDDDTSPEGNLLHSKRYEILVFSVQGFTFGIESHQIHRLTAIGDVPEQMSLYYLHEKLPLGTLIGAYRVPTVVLPRSGDGNIGILIDNISDFHRLDPFEKKPLPPLMRGYPSLRCISCVVGIGGRTVFVIDLTELVRIPTTQRDMPLPNQIKKRRTIDPPVIVRSVTHPVTRLAREAR